VIPIPDLNLLNLVESGKQTKKKMWGGGTCRCRSAHAGGLYVNNSHEISRAPRPEMTDKTFVTPLFLLEALTYPCSGIPLKREHSPRQSGMNKTPNLTASPAKRKEITKDLPTLLDDGHSPDNNCTTRLGNYSVREVGDKGGVCRLSLYKELVDYSTIGLSGFHRKFLYEVVSWGSGALQSLQTGPGTGKKDASVSYVSCSLGNSREDTGASRVGKNAVTFT